MIETKLLIVTGVVIFVTICMVGPAIYKWRKRRF